MDGQPFSMTSHYLSRPPERLVLEGYRHWTKSVVTASPVPMDDAHDLYRDLLGAALCKPAFIAMADFVHTLGVCAKCPLHMFATNTPDICTDETLILGLISGIQNGADDTVELCLNRLSCSSRCDEVAMAAGSFALILKGARKTLIPIPAAVITSVLARQKSMTVDSHHNSKKPTLH